MKVIFLDFDGVLNFAEYFQSKEIDMPFLDDGCMNNLERIVNETGAEIVLTTTWREYWDRKKCEIQGEEINRIFSKYGMSIYDKTPDVCFFDRGAEISLWLLENEDDVSFVVIDDMDIEGIPSRYVVKTDERQGLTLADAQKAIEILNKQQKQS